MKKMIITMLLVPSFALGMSQGGDEGRLDLVAASGAQRTNTDGGSSSAPALSRADELMWDAVNNGDTTGLNIAELRGCNKTSRNENGQTAFMVALEKYTEATRQLNNLNISNQKAEDKALYYAGVSGVTSSAAVGLLSLKTGASCGKSCNNAAGYGLFTGFLAKIMCDRQKPVKSLRRNVNRHGAVLQALIDRDGYLNWNEQDDAKFINNVLAGDSDEARALASYSDALRKSQAKFKTS